MVGARGFEPPTPCPPDKCANRAALRSDTPWGDVPVGKIGLSRKPERESGTRIGLPAGEAANALFAMA